MAVRRRISATYKDLPGGQVLGPSYDYTHRLLDFALAAEDGVGEPQAACAERPVEAAVPRVTDILNHEGLIEEEIALNDEVPRSEEHTSELQSLMRISYAVFCLKKKKNNNKIDTTVTQKTVNK